MLAMTADRRNSIQRAARALLIFFIFMSVIFLWSTLANIVHPFPPEAGRSQALCSKVQPSPTGSTTSGSCRWGWAPH